MSADRYSVCPKCKNDPTKDIENPLREFWDFGFIEDGQFVFECKAECRHCGFKVFFKKPIFRANL